MVDYVAFLALALIGVLQQDTQAVRGVSQDDQPEQEVRNPLRRLPLELWGEMRGRETNIFLEAVTHIHHLVPDSRVRRADRRGSRPRRHCITGTGVYKSCLFQFDLHLSSGADSNKTFKTQLVMPSQLLLSL